jgi:hypothetical protein
VRGSERAQGAHSHESAPFWFPPTRLTKSDSSESAPCLS